jgi:hypothetical protein
MPITKELKNAVKSRSELYRFAKKNNLSVDWKMKTVSMKRIVDDFKSSKANTIAKTFRQVKLSKDKTTLNSINQTSGKHDLTLGRFKRIRKNIVSPADKKLLLHIKDSNDSVVKTYHLNDRIMNIDNLFMNEENQYSSGADVELNIIPSSKVAIEWLPNPPRSRSERKNFFRYLTKSVYYDLEAFQVYSELELDSSSNDDSFDPEKDDDSDGFNYPCFLFALHKAGVSPHVVKQISQTMFNSGATVDFIRKTAKAFNLTISVKQFRVNNETGRANSKITVYGDVIQEAIELGSVGEHLFAILPTKITKAALDNPNLVEENQRADFIVKRDRASFKNKQIKFLDSYEVISYLFHNRERLLDPITQRSMPFLLNSKYQEVRELNEEDFDAINFNALGRGEKMKLKLGQAPFKKYDRETKSFVETQKYNVVYFDFETLVKDGIHVPYCVSYCIGEVDSSEGLFCMPKFSETTCIYGFECAALFIESLPSKSYNLLWAYNARFDFRFLVKHMSFGSKESNVIDAGTKIKQVQGFYRGREIVIKDAMSFLAGGLSSLPSMFKGATDSISLEKECFPHNLINADNYTSQWPLEYLDSFKDNDVLIENATKIGAASVQLFNCEMYATHYCNRDVDVLKLCFEAFRKLVYEEFTLDVYRFLSISSLSLAYQHNEGCFDGCYEMNSILLGFIRQSTVGGRVMTRDNQKHHIKHKLADFDAVSLYPSAMSELNGYVIGKPKLFRDAIPSDADFYIARVRIESICKERHFPLQSFYDNGSRNFTNDLAGRTLIMGKQALEDLINFQGAKCTIIEGCYWNDGFNNKICETISKMFNARLKYKAEGNPLQNVLKPMMNSSYGKLLMKPIVKKKVIVSNSKVKPNNIDDYTRKNIHRMISRTPISDRMALFEEHKSLTEHFSPVHLGVQVLDSSKHIMNRVMCLAEDINADIWYQDTDSLHIDYDKVPVLAESYRDKYGKELIGKQMGQFHVDFDLKGSKGNIFAYESIFLGKKSYLDLLACDGNDVVGQHVRMKGIPGKLLAKDTLKKYMDLYNGERLEFDLSEICSIDINSKTQVVSKRTEFKRNVSF